MQQLRVLHLVNVAGWKYTDRISGGTSSAATQSQVAENSVLTLKIVSSKNKANMSDNIFTSHTVFSFYRLEQVMPKYDRKESFEEDFGYIEPGHGVKGKPRWLCDENVADMYTLHDGKNFYCGITQPL